jgi:hypothetical protein
VDIHRPKAWHGGRELLKEIAIIVLGVLIALGAEQAVQAFDWANKAGLAEGLMRAEIAGDDGPQAYVRIATAWCDKQELEELRALIEDGAPRGVVVKRIQPIWEGYDTYTWDSAAYRAADVSGVLVHLPRDRLSALAQFYELMPILNTHSEREATSLAHLQALSGKGGAISEAERMSLLAAVEELLNENRWIRAASTNAADAMLRTGVRLDRGGQSVFDNTVADVRRRPEMGACLAKGLSDLRNTTSRLQTTRYFLAPDDQFYAPAKPAK